MLLTAVLCASALREIKLHGFNRDVISASVASEEKLLLIQFLCFLQDLTLTKKHVPDAQHRRPRQSPREGAHEPLGHVQDGLQLVLLQVAVSHRRDAAQQSVQDLPVQLDRLLWSWQGTAVRTDAFLLL